MIINEAIFEQRRQLRRAAFFAVVVSTMVVIASVITLPMLYSYVANFQSYLLNEAEFCKVFKTNFDDDSLNIYDKF